MKKFTIKFWYGFGNWCGSQEQFTEEEAHAKIAAVAQNGVVVRYNPDTSEAVAIPWHRISRVTITPVELK